MGARRPLTIAAASLLLGAAATQDLPPPGSASWEPLVFRSIARHTHYEPLDGGSAVRASADCAASALVLPLPSVDLTQTPLLQWRWRVDRTLDVEDERSKAGDDFAARVYLMFRFEPEKASFYERARRRLGQQLFGVEMPGRALSFVWASRLPSGTVWPSPYGEDSRLLAMAQGPSEDWKIESVDVVETYRRSFGAPPPALLALGIMSDADDTCQQAVARYADFRFTSGR